MNGSFSLALADPPTPGGNPIAPGGCDIMLDLDRGKLDIRSTGLWGADVTDRFLAGMEDVLDRFALSGRPPRSLLTTIDLRGHNIQARETIDRVQPHIPRYHELSKRTAVLVSPSALARMQAERLLKVDRHRFFTSEIGARNWLVLGIEG